jgi:atypical dual specificity phosphatase
MVVSIRRAQAAVSCRSQGARPNVAGQTESATGGSALTPQTHWADRLYARTVFYPTLLWNSLLGRCLKVRNWWDPIDPFVLLGGYPFASDAKRLFDVGVRAVVNTCEEYCGPLSHYKRLGIQQFYMPTTDFTHPSLQDVTAAVEFVQQHVSRGETVYIHCKAGRARSATVAICWLIKYRGMNAKDAQAHLLAARPHVNPHIDQRPVVQQFVDQLAKSGQEKRA